MILPGAAPQPASTFSTAYRSSCTSHSVICPLPIKLPPTLTVAAANDNPFAPCILLTLAECDPEIVYPEPSAAFMSLSADVVGQTTSGSASDPVAPSAHDSSATASADGTGGFAGTGTPSGNGSISAVAAATFEAGSKCLHIRNARLPNRTIPALAAALTADQTITDIKFMRCALTLADLAQLAAVLPTLRHLRALFVDHNPLPGSSAASTVAATTTGGTGGGTRGPAPVTAVDTAAAVAFASLLSPPCSLTLLSLRGNALADAFLVSAAPHLRHPSSKLRSLVLSRNRISRVGVEALAEVLATSPSCPLMSLCLAGNALTDEAVAALARVCGKVPLGAEEAATRKRYFAELERLKVVEEENLLQQELEKKKKPVGKPNTARGGSAEGKAGGKAGAGNAAAPATAAGAKTGANTGGGGKGASGPTPASGVPTSLKASASDLAGSVAGSPAKKKPVGGASTSQDKAGAKKGTGAAGKGKANEAVAEVAAAEDAAEAEVEAIVVPPGIDLDLFDIGGVCHVWGNRNLAHLNLAHNRLTANGMVAFLCEISLLTLYSAVAMLVQTIVDQVPCDKALLTSNMYSTDPALLERPRHGILRVVLEGNLFPMDSTVLESLAHAIGAKEAALTVNAPPVLPILSTRVKAA
ncbi:hypothetical protein BC828DRAFT_390171 [Blastocladiella britannica]|nr:hypothetical protein BC828DRAFT_390171 [Blastocladiella britannica]